jgi:hypothetical protein
MSISSRSAGDPELRYDYGFNNDHTEDHEVLETVGDKGPYVVLKTRTRATAEAIALLLNAEEKELRIEGAGQR